MKEPLKSIHYFITGRMADSWIVENILIAEVTEEENGELVTYDCIYCTILRVAVIFTILGIILGLLLCQLI